MNAVRRKNNGSYSYNWDIFTYNCGFLDCFVGMYNIYIKTLSATENFFRQSRTLHLFATLNSQRSKDYLDIDNIDLIRVLCFNVTHPLVMQWLTDFKKPYVVLSDTKREPWEQLLKNFLKNLKKAIDSYSNHIYFLGRDWEL